jgi:hypothetical protein
MRRRGKHQRFTTLYGYYVFMASKAHSEIAVKAEEAFRGDSFAVGIWRVSFVIADSMMLLCYDIIVCIRLAFRNNRLVTKEETYENN